jgi:hypothetical protein
VLEESLRARAQLAVAFMFMHNFVFENGDLGRPPLGWREEGMPRWLNGLRPIFSLG